MRCSTLHPARSSSVRRTRQKTASAPIDVLAPDVVVMDWSMPGMSGIEATAELRRTRPELRVVGFTSTDDRIVHEAFLEAGATAVFAKEHALDVREYLLATAAVA